MLKRDIESRADVTQFVDAFYHKLLEDPLVKHFFLEIMEAPLSEHLPIIYDFWESVLFRLGNYQRNTMEKHLELHQLSPLRKEHFDRWLALFFETIDQLFEGKRAEDAKARARSIAIIMKLKIDQLEKWRQELNN
jgi:hemoglobin